MAAATLATGDRDHFRTLVLKGTRGAAAIDLPIGLILLVMCKPFLRLWMGPEYAWSWIVYAIVMIAMVGRITQAPTLWVLIGGGQIRGLAYMQMAAAVATIMLSITLVTQTTLGVVGVVIGITIPLFVSHSVFLP
jgi:O-antigen/teichoic acid export membrane protein